MTFKRREFLASTSAAAFVVATHGPLAWAGADPIRKRSVAGQGRALITGLRLKTAAPLAAMREFYNGRLGLRVLDESSRTLTIGGGATPITFETATADQGRPFYHFAFNIPQNKILGARRWQLERSELLPVLPQLLDPEYPDDVVHFRHWNAHSVFFLDPAENIVEYIARHDLDNSAPGPFTVDDILHASEIAFVVDDVPTVASDVMETFDLGRYRGGGKGFHAIGDEQGLLLVFQRGRRLSLARPEPKLADIFPTEATIRGPSGTRHRVPKFPYGITTA